MKVQIRVLVENTTPHMPLLGEYGWSALVSVDDHNILFDTGSDQALFINSQHLHIPLNEVHDLVISHGHIDHTGVVMPFLRHTQTCRITAHPGIFATRYAVFSTERRLNISCPFTEQEAIAAGASFNYTQEFGQVLPGVYVTGEIPRVTSFEDVGGNFEVETPDGLKSDLIPDDMAMVIDHPEGLIIISGCAHSGVVNTLEYVRQMLPDRPIQAYIGGMHLLNASSQRLANTIAYFKKHPVERILVGHCTGFYAEAGLYNALERKVVKVAAGMHIGFSNHNE